MNQSTERILQAFQIVMNKMNPKMIEIMLEEKVTPTQFFVMNFLNKKGSCTVSQLAEKIDVKPSAVTALTDRLEQNNLVLREHDKKDRRVVNIRLTEQGVEKLSAISAKRKEVVKQVLTHLSEDEVSTMATIFEKLAGIVQDENA